MAAAPISEDYRLEQQKLHKSAQYGVASSTFAPLVGSLLKAGQCTSLSDYGAGKCNLKQSLGLTRRGSLDYFPYDPAFPEYGQPRAADLVTCIDVLEHVEADRLETCLDQLASITRRLILLTIHTGPAKKLLSGGRNAHLIQQPPSWWLPHLQERFDILHVQQVRKGFFVIGCPKGEYLALQSQMDFPAISLAAARCQPRKKRKRLVGTLVQSFVQLFRTT